MISFGRRLSTRLGRWPRRVAAAVCLALAVLSALSPTDARPAPAPSHTSALATDEVAVAVPVTSAALARYLHAGDRVGVLYSPADGAPGDPLMVADHLRVLSVLTESDYGTDAATTVMIATDRPTAVRLARFPTDYVRLVVDRSP